MIKSLAINNFKGLNRITIPFSSLTIIIGDNATGKSTVLQVLSFLKYCCTSYTSKYMDDWRLSVSEIASKLSNRRIMSFRIELELEGQTVEWEIAFAINRAKNSIALHSERVTSGNVIYMLYDGSQKSFFFNELTGKKDSIMPGDYDCSILRVVDTGKSRKSYPILCSIKRFFSNVEDVELLSPDVMRRNSRGRADVIGTNGESLGAFIKTLSLETREMLAQDIRKFQPAFRSLNPKTAHGGWVHLEAKEMCNGKPVEVKASNISDGMLRIIAMCALQYASCAASGVILLDEIENGVNTEHLERLVKILYNIRETRSIQIIATTHSTALLDYWIADKEKDERSIVFLARDESGQTLARSFLDAPAVQEKLEYMSLGEIVLNMSNDGISGMMGEEL